MNGSDKIKHLLGLTEDEIIEILGGKDDQSIFAVYMAGLNFYDYGYHIFKEHDMNMRTELPANREVDGCSCLYQVLLRTPFRMREDGGLFAFIRNSIILNRNLKEGELL